MGGTFLGEGFPLGYGTLGRPRVGEARTRKLFLTGLLGGGLKKGLSLTRSWRTKGFLGQERLRGKALLGFQRARGWGTDFNAVFLAL